MEKILLAIDAQQMNMNAVDFACYLARLTHSGLTGIFLENLSYDERPVLQSVEGLPFMECGRNNNLQRDQVKEIRTEENIRLFKESCGNRGVLPKIHRDRGVPVAEIVAESRFADIIVADAETSFTKSYEASPARFVKDILMEAECPVIIAP